MIPVRELIERLHHLAERMPQPYTEDRYYGDREIAQLKFDTETVKAAAVEMVRLSVIDDAALQARKEGRA